MVFGCYSTLKVSLQGTGYNAGPLSLHSKCLIVSLYQPNLDGSWNCNSGNDCLCKNYPRKPLLLNRFLQQTGDLDTEGWFEQNTALQDSKPYGRDTSPNCKVLYGAGLDTCHLFSASSQESLTHLGEFHRNTTCICQGNNAMNERPSIKL